MSVTLGKSLSFYFSLKFTHFKQSKPGLNQNIQPRFSLIFQGLQDLFQHPAVTAHQYILYSIIVSFFGKVPKFIAFVLAIAPATWYNIKQQLEEDAPTFGLNN
jgi:hypothetical protein